jgi:tetratricopeptide (TPR) repeat protein
MVQGSFAGGFTGGECWGICDFSLEIANAGPHELAVEMHRTWRCKRCGLKTIGLSMIVKNGGEELRSCLSSVRSLVDQIVIADTGSTDNTVAVAKEFGATVVSFPWTDHYAEARNAALEPMTTDWVLSLDADEELCPEAVREIPKLLQHTGEEVGGYRLTIRSYFPVAVASLLGVLSRENGDDVERARKAKSYGDYRLCRLFRRHSGIRFAGRVHEGVEPMIRGAGYRCMDSDLRILHFGHLAEETGYQKKQDYYRGLLWTAVRETPHYPHLWVQLAIEERRHLSSPERVMECAEEAVRLNPNEYEGWSIIGALHQEQKQYEMGMQAIEHLPDSGDWGVTRARALGDCLHQLGRFSEARTMYSRALERVGEQDAYPVDFRADIESRLGYTEVQLGVCELGFRRLHRAVDRSPAAAENHERLTKAYVLRQNERGAADAAESSLQYISDEKIYRRAVALRVRLRERERAAMLVEAGLQLFPQSAALRQMRCEVDAM